MAGLDPKGVPRNLRETVIPFRYNQIEELENILKENEVGNKMEVSRNEGPKDNFLEKVRKLASHHGAVLIFDECTSGFREIGGLLQEVWY